ncbi:MAG: hypothetical protein AAGU75_04210 [Bacillota bacterium]
MLQVVRKKSCIMDSAIKESGNVPLKEYVKRFKPYQGKPIQSADDFLMISKEYNEALLGEKIAEELDQVLRFPLLNTANHHGVDFFPPSVQGNLLFWQALKENGIQTKYLPICSFGIVSLSNSSYARGITSYSVCDKHLRIPIFPKSIENKMVRYVPAFTEEQIKRTIFRLNTEFRELKASEEIRQTLEKYYLNETVLNQKYYGDQAVFINLMLSKDMYPDGDLPQIVYMEMEQIINQLLIKDLKDENSMIYRILYDNRILNGIRRQMEEGNTSMSTMFFWGTDSAGRRFVLDFCPDGYMRGKTLAGEIVTLPAGSKDIESLIEQERIVPSGYTMAVLLSFARGYTWLGGYFQGDYLPEWQKGTALAFSMIDEYRDWAESIMNYDCSGYISGPVYALNQTEEGLLVPAGPLEIIHSGGINQKRLDYLLEATVTESHIMGLYNSYSELIPPALRRDNWSHSIGEWLSDSYTNYLIPKDLRVYKRGGVFSKEQRLNAALY